MRTTAYHVLQGRRYPHPRYDALLDIIAGYQHGHAAAARVPGTGMGS